ncbi:MAG: FAD-dependent oxidoreductase, partial [Clostridiales bacterium]|nr:FAD-dependent oxidoreductase [Clostridiales bacterium]
MSANFSKRTVKADIAVIGAGLAGLCAALSAARNGYKVALVTDRSVLGGNASSEIRVNPRGADYAPWNRYARETGIMEEIFNHILARAQRAGQWSWQDFDAVYFDLVFSEKNIALELNTYIHKAEKKGAAIVAVEGNQSRSETLLRIEADSFIDASGDGTVGRLAGCETRAGTESRHEFGEYYGPEQPEPGTMGTTLLFTGKNVGHKTEFKTPDWAVPFGQTDAAYRIAHSIFPTADGNYGGFWWLECGGDADPIRDDNALSLHLRKAVYGLWGFIKNSGLYPDSECHELDWIGYLGGKRESRRLMGEHIVNSVEIMNQVDYPDNIGYTGWPIDVHPKEGYKSTTCGCTHYWLPGPANMPARMLISKDVPNLLFAGRCVSATREALGTLRLICTTAVMGQAAGTIAALSLENGKTPGGLVRQNYDVIERRLLKDDQ